MTQHTESKYFCALPFLHYEIKTFGHVAPCCVSRTVYQDENGVPFNVASTDIDTIVNSKDAISMRQAALENRPVRGCEECYLEESEGNVTRRMRENAKWAKQNRWITQNKFDHVYLDLKLGNLCNLACRICNVWSSSRWVDDMRQAGHFDMFNSKVNYNFKWYESEQYWNKLEQVMPHIEYIDLYGGEPFLIKQQFEFLEKIVKQGHAEHITLNYATNGSTYPKHAIENIWPNFKTVHFLFSADGVGKTFEYARYPGKWDIFETNLKRFVYEHGYQPKISFGLSNYSVWNLMDSFEYYEKEFKGDVKLWLNIVYNNGADVVCMPEKLKQRLLDQINSRWRDEWQKLMHEKTWEGMYNHISTVDSGTEFNDWKQFCTEVAKYDKVRGQKIIDFIPEYEGWL
mgnify:FL=1|tara:strand:+ start:6581 stop:7780 length:1200 start_codon:yes stop_codon:yes gene_type:complete